MKRVFYLALLSAITFISSGNVKAQSIADVPLAGDVAIVPQTPISDWVVSILPYLLIPLAILIVLYFAIRSRKPIKSPKKKSTKK